MAYSEDKLEDLEKKYFKTEKQVFSEKDYYNSLMPPQELFPEGLLVFEKILNDAGVFVVKKLGAGMFHVAYSVVYKGKNAVAKITKDPAEQMNILKYFQLKNKLPDEFKKNILEIYDAFSHTVEFQSDISKKKQNKIATFYITIVEFLEKMDPYLFDVIGGKITEYNYDENRENINLKIKDSLPEKLNLLKKGYEPLFSDPLFKKEFDKIFDYFSNITLDQIAALQDNLFYIPLTHRASRSIFENIKEFIQEDIEMPRNHNYYKDFSRFDIMPETAHFMSFLKYLEKFNIRWADVHANNIMRRPGTEDLVLSDPGVS